LDNVPSSLGHVNRQQALDHLISSAARFLSKSLFYDLSVIKLPVPTSIQPCWKLLIGQLITTQAQFE